MNTKVDFNAGDQGIVYVKPIKTADLPADVQAQAEGLEQIYSVHSADGAQLALVADQRLAFQLAREHDMAPVRVH